MAKNVQSGRTRIVATVVLMVLIGAAGALILPRLLHEATPPATTTVCGEICIGVPLDGGLEATGVLRVTARRPGCPDLDVAHAFPKTSNEETVLGALARLAGEAGWTSEAADLQVAGGCLSFAEVTQIGGDPGLTGAAMSWAVSGRPGQAIHLRIRVEGGPGPRAVIGPEMRISLTARGTVPNDGGAVETAQVVLTAPWIGARGVLEILTTRLVEEGWTTNASGEATEGLVVRALPGGGAIGSAILTVAYETAGYGDLEATRTYLWTLSP